MKYNVKNERIKKRFIEWLADAEGCADATINNIEKAVLIYEEFTKRANFGTFSPKKAVEFKKHLKAREFRSKPISLSTYYSYLRHLQKFFIWLTWQPGYKTKIKRDAIDYLKVKDKEQRIATQSAPRNYPTLVYVVNLVESIKIKTEIDKRDQALIAFTLVSGMRDEAIVSLPLGCFDEDKLIIRQDPKAGVKTKFSKYIYSKLFAFDDGLLAIVLDWIKCLSKKGFGAGDPIFPRARTVQGDENLSFEKASEVEPAFWQGTGRMRAIFKERSKAAGMPYFAPHTFRHLAVDLALKHCSNGEEMKAVSQNFGHEYIATTLSAYANFQTNRLTDILKNIDFSKNGPALDNDKLEQIRKIILTK